MSIRRPSASLLAAATLLAANGGLRAETATATTWHPPLLANSSTHPASLDHPAWVEGTIEPTNHARIARIIEGKADVVVLDSGLYQGLRNGVKCLVERSGVAVAELIVVAAQQDRSAALITQLPSTVILVPGDDVHIKSISIE